MSNTVPLPGGVMMETTQTEEIERSEWPVFADAFSRQRMGWRVTVEVFGRRVGAQMEAEAMAFEGLSIDTPEGHEPVVSIMVGDAADRHATHTITAPSHIRLERSTTPRGVVETLEIEKAGEPTTLVRFEESVTPEMLDGYVET
jgi:hypothetical protein